VFVCRSQTAGKIRLLEDAFEARPFVAMTGVRGMAAQTIDVINATALGLLRVQAEFGIRHLFRILPTTAKQHD
jgi:hypothetical protein